MMMTMSTHDDDDDDDDVVVEVSRWSIASFVSTVQLVASSHQKSISKLFLRRIQTLVHEKNGVSVRVIFHIEERMPFLSIDFVFSILLGCPYMHHIPANSVENVHTSGLLYFLDVLRR